jgi:hypothetical protein
MEAEAARMEALDGGFAPLDLKQSNTKLVTYHIASIALAGHGNRLRAHPPIAPAAEVAA